MFNPFKTQTLVDCVIPCLHDEPDLIVDSENPGSLPYGVELASHGLELGLWHMLVRATMGDGPQLAILSIPSIDDPSRWIGSGDTLSAERVQLLKAVTMRVKVDEVKLNHVTVDTVEGEVKAVFPKGGFKTNAFTWEVPHLFAEKVTVVHE